MSQVISFSKERESKFNFRVKPRKVVQHQPNVIQMQVQQLNMAEKICFINDQMYVLHITRTFFSPEDGAEP